MKAVIQFFFSKPKLWSHLQTLLITLIWWNLFFRLFITLQYLTTSGYEIRELTPKLLLVLNERVLIAFVIVTLFATINYAFEIFVFVKFSQRKNFLVTFCLKLLSYLLGFSLFGICLGSFHYYIEKGLVFEDTIQRIDNFLLNPIGLYLFIVGLFIKYTLDVFLGSLRRTGFSMLWKSLFGKYKNPFEENRIFIFLDLVSSTKYSQKLGHKKYSAFLQECFYTISSSIVNNRGIIYQFVGDEVVVTWKGDNKANYRRAIDFFFQFSDDLLKKEKLFMDKFGILPEFTASLNSGKVMVAEVGDLKTEIAYHGSVLNTASRLQKQCRKYGVGLLATEFFIENLEKTSNNYTSEYMDFVHLPGKENSEKVYQIKRKLPQDYLLKNKLSKSFATF